MRRHKTKGMWLKKHEKRKERKGKEKFGEDGVKWNLLKSGKEMKIIKKRRKNKEEIQIKKKKHKWKWKKKKYK